MLTLTLNVNPHSKPNPDHPDLACGLVLCLCEHQRRERLCVVMPTDTTSVQSLAQTDHTARAHTTNPSLPSRSLSGAVPSCSASERP